MSGRLLVVDDHDMNREALARRLRKSGYVVSEAGCGGDVMPILQEQGFDLVLLDIRMPDIDGLRVLQSLRQKFSMAELPVIMLSAESDSGVMVEAFRVGANDYVTKPIDFQVTLARIQALLIRKSLDQGDAPAPAPVEDLNSLTMVGEERTLPEEIPVGTKLGCYTIAGILGRGGMGIVYEAEDSTLDRRAAVKVLHRKYSADTQWTTRFRREAQAAARVEHANVVGIYNIGMWRDHHYISMQLIKGETTAALVRQQGALPWREATNLVLQACRGLAAAHARSVLHRDIKPENIMVAQDGSVKLLDFGLATMEEVSSDNRLTLPGAIIGTPHFMSPEQCRGLTIDARSDIYQMGATYYHLLTARNPYPYQLLFEILNAHCGELPPDPRHVVTDMPAPCSEIVLKAMDKGLHNRYQSAQELQSALEAVLA